MEQSGTFSPAAQHSAGTADRLQGLLDSPPRHIALTPPPSLVPCEEIELSSGSASSSASIDPFRLCLSTPPAVVNTTLTTAAARQCRPSPHRIPQQEPFVSVSRPDSFASSLGVPPSRRERTDAKQPPAASSSAAAAADDAETRRLARDLLYKGEETVSALLRGPGDTPTTTVPHHHSRLAEASPPLAEKTPAHLSEEFETLVYGAGLSGLNVSAATNGKIRDEIVKEINYNGSATDDYTFAENSNDDGDETDLSMAIVASVTYRGTVLRRCWERWAGRREARAGRRLRLERYAAAYHANILQIIFFRAWQWRYEQRCRARGREALASEHDRLSRQRRVLGAWRSYARTRGCQRRTAAESGAACQRELMRHFFRIWSKAARHSLCVVELAHRVAVCTATEYLRQWVEWLFARQRERLCRAALDELHSPTHWLQAATLRGAAAASAVSTHDSGSCPASSSQANSAVGLTNKERVRLAYRVYFLQWLRVTSVRRGWRLQRLSRVCAEVQKRTQEGRLHQAWNDWIRFHRLRGVQKCVDAALQRQYWNKWSLFAHDVENCRAVAARHDALLLTSALHRWYDRLCARKASSAREERAHNFVIAVVNVNRKRFCLGKMRHEYHRRREMQVERARAEELRRSLVGHLTLRRLSEAVRGTVGGAEETQLLPPSPRPAEADVLLPGSWTRHAPIPLYAPQPPVQSVLAENVPHVSAPVATSRVEETVPPPPLAAPTVQRVDKSVGTDDGGGDISIDWGSPPPPTSRALAAGTQTEIAPAHLSEGKDCPPSLSQPRSETTTTSATATTSTWSSSSHRHRRNRRHHRRNNKTTMKSRDRKKRRRQSSTLSPSATGESSDTSPGSSVFSSFSSSSSPARNTSSPRAGSRAPPSTVTAAESRPSVVYYPVFLPSNASDTPSHLPPPLLPRTPRLPFPPLAGPGIAAVPPLPSQTAAPPPLSPPTGVYYGFDISRHADPFNMTSTVGDAVVAPSSAFPAASPLSPSLQVPPPTSAVAAAAAPPATVSTSVSVSVSPDDSAEELQAKGRLLVAAYRRLRATAAAEDAELMAVEEEIQMREHQHARHQQPQGGGRGSDTCSPASERLESLRRRSLELYERRLLRAQLRAQVMQLTALLEHTHGVSRSRDVSMASDHNF